MLKWKGVTLSFRARDPWGCFPQSRLNSNGASLLAVYCPYIQGFQLTPRYRSFIVELYHDRIEAFAHTL